MIKAVFMDHTGTLIREKGADLKKLFSGYEALYGAIPKI